MPDAVDAVVCAPDDGWYYHSKHLQQFPDKINCVTLHHVRHILENCNCRRDISMRPLVLILHYAHVMEGRIIENFT
jgi:hypothetical protein